MKPNKKPTMMEVKNVITNIINEIGNLTSNMRAIDLTLGAFIEYKKDTKKFTKWLEKQGKDKEKKDELDLPNKRSKKTIKKMPK